MLERIRHPNAGARQEHLAKYTGRLLLLGLYEPSKAKESAKRTTEIMEHHRIAQKGSLVLRGLVPELYPKDEKHLETAYELANVHEQLDPESINSVIQRPSVPIAPASFKDQNAVRRQFYKAVDRTLTDFESIAANPESSADMSTSTIVLITEPSLAVRSIKHGFNICDISDGRFAQLQTVGNMPQNNRWTGVSYLPPIMKEQQEEVTEDELAMTR